LFYLILKSLLHMHKIWDNLPGLNILIASFIAHENAGIISIRALSLLAQPQRSCKD